MVCVRPRPALPWAERLLPVPFPARWPHLGEYLNKVLILARLAVKCRAVTEEQTPGISMALTSILL